MSEVSKLLPREPKEVESEILRLMQTAIQPFSYTAVQLYSRLLSEYKNFRSLFML